METKKVVNLADYKKLRNAMNPIAIPHGPAIAPPPLMDLENGMPPHRINTLMVNMSMVGPFLPPATLDQLKRITELCDYFHIDESTDLCALTKAAVSCDLDVEGTDCPFYEKCTEWNVLEAASIIDALEHSEFVDEEET